MYISGAGEIAHMSLLLWGTEGRPCKWRLACPTGEVLHRHPQTAPGIENHHVQSGSPIWLSNGGEQTRVDFSPSPLPPSLPYSVGALILGGFVPSDKTESKGEES